MAKPVLHAQTVKKEGNFELKEKVFGAISLHNADKEPAAGLY